MSRRRKSTRSQSRVDLRSEELIVAATDRLSPGKAGQSSGSEVTFHPRHVDARVKIRQRQDDEVSADEQSPVDYDNRKHQFVSHREDDPEGSPAQSNVENSPVPEEEDEIQLQRYLRVQ